MCAVLHIFRCVTHRDTHTHTLTPSEPLTALYTIKVSLSFSAKVASCPLFCPHPRPALQVCRCQKLTPVSVASTQHSHLEICPCCSTWHHIGRTDFFLLLSHGLQWVSHRCPTSYSDTRISSRYWRLQPELLYLCPRLAEQMSHIPLPSGGVEWLLLP